MTMRNILLSTVAVLALTGSALAADLPSTKSAPVFVAPAPVFSWTGVYIGVEGGGDFRDYRDRFTGVTISKEAGLVGGLIGFNYQFANNFVVGLEGDAAAILGGNRAYNQTINAVVYNNTYNSNYAAAIRGRLGVAAFNNALLYVAGGVAFGDTRVNYPAVLAPSAYTTSRTGWTIGGGVDYAFTSNWIGRLEYRYVDLGTGGFINYGGFVNDRIRVSSSEVIGALIYKFGYAAPVPVVAKY
jgi:outer membrane immunogenic protein